VKLAFLGIVTIFTERDDVTETMPSASLQSWQQGFCRQSGLDDKFRARLQRPAYVFQKLRICIAVQVTEAVSKTEGTIESFLKVDIADIHPDALEVHSIRIRRLASLRDEFVGQIDTTHRIASLGELQRGDHFRKGCPGHAIH
jgi:hypothetical protein